MKAFAQLLRWRVPGALLLLIAVTMLTACNGTSVPELIATYPRSGHPRSEPPPGVPAQLDCLPSRPLRNTQTERLARAVAGFAARFRSTVDIFGRFTTAFTQALATVLIWLGAVAGPFVLMAVGALTMVRWLLRRLPDDGTGGKGDRGR